MSACLVFMILMGHRFSAECQSTCASNDTLTTFYTTAGDDVAVPCPQLTGEHLTFNLLQSQELIYSYSKNKNNVSKNGSPHSMVDVKMDENKNKSFSFRLIGVNASCQDIYRCEGKVVFPPPLIKACGSRILVLVERHQGIGKYCTSLEAFPWIWIAVVACFIIYSITATVIAIINWVKLRKTDSQSDYMNTKPRAPRGHNKKRGAGTHIGLPRHF